MTSFRLETDRAETAMDIGPRLGAYGIEAKKWETPDITCVVAPTGSQAQKFV